MNEEIEYAEMLEIPVSTVNVLRGRSKKPRNPFKKQTAIKRENSNPQDLKSSLIARVNGEERLEPQPERTEEPPVVTPFEGFIGYDEDTPIENTTDEFSDRLFVERLSSPQKAKRHRLLALKNATTAYQAKPQPDPFSEEENPLENAAYNNENGQNEGGRYETNKTIWFSELLLKTEFALACALSATIFLTNVFMPNSAINTFFANGKKQAGDSRTYRDFTLSGVVSDLSDTSVEITEAGVITFTDECMVYPAADGTVSSVEESEDGSFVVKISHSDSFTGVVEGLNRVYYNVGEAVKSNVPLGFTTGEKAVQVTMYSQGELLNCFEMSNDNCLVWVEQK
jgi:hypothetical protein